jgi:hypothetical protein
MATELRRFTINRGKLDEFVEGWRERVLPLREEHGFHIPAAWKIPERNEFFWLLAYEGPESFETQDAAYYASAARAALQPDPAQLIAKPEAWFIDWVIRCR